MQQQTLHVAYRKAFVGIGLSDVRPIHRSALTAPVRIERVRAALTVVATDHLANQQVVGLRALEIDFLEIAGYHIGIIAVKHHLHR